MSERSIDLPQWPIFHFRETNDVEWFVSLGYAYVHHDIRGSGKSVEGGSWKFFCQEEQNDFYDVIEWTAEQPWCDGNVGMIGGSLLGWVQWFAAAMQPPHLKCIAPFDTGADMYRDVAYHGGIMSLGFQSAWYTAESRTVALATTNAPIFLGQFGARSTCYFPGLLTFHANHPQQIYYCFVHLAGVDISIAYCETEAYNRMRGEAPRQFGIFHTVPTCRDRIPDIPDCIRTHYSIHRTCNNFRSPQQ